MSKKNEKEHVERFITEAFQISCAFTKQIALIRYQTRKRFPFGKRKLITREEFKNMVLKEFEEGIKQLPENPERDLKTITKNVVNDLKKGNRPKLQKMIQNTYNQILKES